MKIISPSFELLEPIDSERIMANIERCGRVCCKSEEKITHESAESFVRSLIQRGHESVVEHEKITVKITCDRGISHEIIRHRIASYSQESTRYCNYTKDKFGGELTFIKPYFWETDSQLYAIWLGQMDACERGYLNMINLGASPEQARSILPNSLKTEIMMTMNLRQWRHFFMLRTAPNAHLQMREISIPLLKSLNEALPAVFEDLTNCMT